MNHFYNLVNTNAIGHTYICTILPYFYKQKVLVRLDTIILSEHICIFKKHICIILDI